MLTLLIFTITFIMNEGSIGYSLMTTFNVMQYWLALCIFFDVAIFGFIMYFTLTTNTIIKVTSSMIIGCTLFIDIILYNISSNLSEEIHHGAISLSQLEDNHIILMGLFFIIVILSAVINVSMHGKNNES